MDKFMFYIVAISGLVFLSYSAFSSPHSIEMRKKLIEGTKEIKLIEKRGPIIVTNPNEKRIADELKKKRK